MEERKEIFVSVGPISLMQRHKVTMQTHLKEFIPCTFRWRSILTQVFWNAVRIGLNVIDKPVYDWMTEELVVAFANASIRMRHNLHPPVSLPVIAPESFLQQFLVVTAQYSERELPVC